MRKCVDEALDRGLEEAEGACDLLAVGGEVHAWCLIVSGNYTYHIHIYIHTPNFDQHENPTPSMSHTSEAIARRKVLVRGMYNSMLGAA